MLLNKEIFMGGLEVVVNGLGLDKAGCYIGLGGASVLLGVSKFTKDVRVAVTEANWERLYSYDPLITLERSSLKAEQEEVRTIHGVSFVFISSEDLYTKKVCRMYGGYFIPTKLQLLKDRIALGRYKDVFDIYSLQEYNRFLNESEKRSMKQIMQSHRGTATA